MKPIIIYLKDDDNSNSKITLERKEFEELIKKTYQQGYDEGHSEGYSKGYTAGCKPSWYPTITYTNSNLQTPVYNPYEVTCNNSGEIK